MFKVAEIINSRLAERIRKQFNYPERKQMIFELVGPDFVTQYFPNEHVDPQLLERPSMLPESRRTLQVDAQKWLQGALSKVVAEVKCQRHGVAEERG